MLNPIVFTERVVSDFLSYQLTAYPFSYTRLYAQLRRLLNLDQTRRSPLLAGPFVLGYAGTTLGMLHLLVGAVISALAALQFRQDRNSSDRNLARHGG